MKNCLVWIAVMLLFGLFMAYHDTALLQNAMGYVFGADPTLAAPPFWQDHRWWILGVVFLLLVAYYTPVWRSARALVRTYRQCPVNHVPPDVSPLQAGFFYSPTQDGLLVIWIIERCLEGCLSLHGQHGAYYPWSVTRGPVPEPRNESDAELANTLFAKEDTVLLRPVLSDSNPSVRKAAALLFGRVKSACADSCESRRSSLLAWLLYAALLAEIPSYNALHQNRPAMIALTLFCSATFAVPFYAAFRQLPSLVMGSVGSMILVVASVLFALVVPLIVFHGEAGHYFAIALLPSLVAAVAVSVHRLPPTPEDEALLPRLIGYKKALTLSDFPFQDEDIPWHFALQVHTGIVNSSPGYAGEGLPPWLVCSEDDPQGVMVELLQKLPLSVSRAVYGEKKSHRSRTRGGGSKHY